MKIKNYCLMFLFLSNSIYAIELWLKVINNGQLMTNSCFEHQIIKNKGVHIKMRDSNDNYYFISVEKVYGNRGEKAINDPLRMSGGKKAPRRRTPGSCGSFLFEIF